MWSSETHDSRDEEVEKVRDALTAGPEGWRANLVTDSLTARSEAVQALPGPTHLPFVASVGLVIVFSAVLTKWYLVKKEIYYS